MKSLKLGGNWSSLMQRLMGSRQLVLSIAGPALLALGTWVPFVQTTMGYSWGSAGNAAMAVYGTAVSVLIMNLVLDKMGADIAKRLGVAAIAILTGCLVYGCSQTIVGMEWFVRQTAHDTPGWSGINADAYWAQLYAYGFGQNIPLVGSLRAAYETYGPDVLLNNQLIFRDTINSLTIGQSKALFSAAGVNYSVLPVGIAAYVGSLIVQIVIFFRIDRNSKIAAG